MVHWNAACMNFRSSRDRCARRFPHPLTKGDDEHQAGRYGQGASAHFGVGLFIDHHGDNRYGSFGPFYNGGVACDSSVSLRIDAGKVRDTYCLRPLDQS